MMKRLLRLWPHPAAIRRLNVHYTVRSVLEGVLLVLLVPVLGALLEAEPDTAAASRWLLALAAAGVAYTVVSWRARSVGYRMAGGIMRDLQHGLGRHVGALPLAWFTADRAGRLARTTAQSTVTAAGTASHVWPDLLGAFVTPATVIVLTAFIDWRVALAFLVAVPLALLVLRWAGPVTRSTQAVMDAAAAESAGRAIEFAQAQPVLRACGRAHEGYAQMERALDELRRTFRAALTRDAAPMLVYLGVVQAGFAVVLACGAWLALGGVADVPGVIALLVLASRFIEPLALVANRYGAIRAGEVALDRVAEVMDAEPLPEPARPAATPRSFDVELDRVTFGYPTVRRLRGSDAQGGRSKDQPALRDVSFRIPAATTTALVGPSGSGKTTITRLVARFADVDAGAVRVGGTDVRDLPYGELLRHVALVFQDTYLFDGTIAENLRLARPEATDAQLRAAAATARLDEMIQRLPDGWSTRVGEGGASLSGGERQRVAIARAILKDAPVVLLDEATSSLDPVNEAAVSAALRELAADRTVLVIAHRLSTVVAADQIVVLDGGRVVESGTHQELLDAGGAYARLWAKRNRARGWRLTTAN